VWECAWESYACGIVYADVCRSIKAFRGKTCFFFLGYLSFFSCVKWDGGGQAGNGSKEGSWEEGETRERQWTKIERETMGRDSVGVQGKGVGNSRRQGLPAQTGRQGGVCAGLTASRIIIFTICVL
jgi:hypothetical protein